MTFQVPLSPETEAEIRKRAAQAGKDPTDFVREAVEEKLASLESETAEPSHAIQRVERFLAWVASHRPQGRLADDSRESIYEGRGDT